MLLLLIITALPALITAIALPSSPEATLDACREAAKSSVEECACFSSCTAIATEKGFNFTMEYDNSTSVLTKRGCGNPSARLTASKTVINFGTSLPWYVSNSMWEQCGQYGCDPSDVQGTTLTIAANNRPGTTTKTHTISRGFYRDWPDRDAAATLIRAAAQAGVENQPRRPYSACKDCDPLPDKNQYYQRDYFQIDHWNSCGHQAQMSVLVTIDNVAANSKACSTFLDAIQGAIGFYSPVYAWLFGTLKAVC